MNGFLAIYEFKIAGLIPAYHTEVVIEQHSFGFSDDGIEINDGPNMDQQYGYRLITSIPLGETQTTQRELREIIGRLERDWSADSYDLFQRNCRHFSLAFINELNCDSSTEARRTLASLIFFSEKVGRMVSILFTGLVHVMPLSPLALVSRPLEIYNQGRILDLESEFKLQLLQILVLVNAAWVGFLFISSWLSRSSDEDEEVVQQLENMTL